MFLCHILYIIRWQLLSFPKSPSYFLFMQNILIVIITSINVFLSSANKITNIYGTIKLFPCFF